jgi:hypothetical protein
MNEAEQVQVKENFLEAYAKTGNILLSCKAAGISRTTFYNWQEKDEEFSFRAHQAEREFADTILAEFIQRAVYGYEKPVVSAGRIVYEEIPELDKYGNQVVDERGKPIIHHKPLMERVVSDNLLAMAVKRHFPEYREKQQIDVNNANTNVQDKALHDKVMEVLNEHPEIKYKIAEVMNELGKNS